MPVIKKTWEKDAFFIQYYSDHADPSIPTVDIGVPNTERGRRWLVRVNLFRLGVSCACTGKCMKNERTHGS